MNIDWSPFIISIKISIISTIITTILGLFIAYKMYKYKGKYKGIIESILTIPLILPPTVVGFILLLILGKNGIIGKVMMLFNQNIIFTWYAAVISAVVVSFPMMYRSLKSSFEQIDINLIHASRTLGLSEFTILKKIMIPLAFPGIIGGIVLSFARALGEFGATLMIAGNIPGVTQTMPIAIFFAVESGDMKLAGMWVMIILMISFMSIILLNHFEKKQQYIMGKR